jgi:hypothetical protein
VTGEDICVPGTSGNGIIYMCTWKPAVTAFDMCVTGTSGKGIRYVVYLEPAVLLDVLYSVLLVSEPLSRVVTAKLLHDCHGRPKQKIKLLKTGYLVLSKVTQFCDRYVNMHTEIERGSVTDFLYAKE